VNTNHTPDWFLLERYFADAVTPEERNQIERWITEDPDRQEMVTRIRAALQARQYRAQRDWQRAGAIETVLRRIREGKTAPAILALPRRVSSESRSATTRLAQVLRHWFEGATELAAAMLLDANEEPLSEDEVQELRDWITNSEPEQP
jgi:hypothetical protein